MYIKLNKIIESYNGNYVYIYIVNNKQNLYIKDIKLLLYEFYIKYNKSGNYINHQFIKKVEIKVDNYQYIKPTDYFDIYV